MHAGLGVAGQEDRVERLCVLLNEAPLSRAQGPIGYGSMTTSVQEVRVHV